MSSTECENPQPRGIVLSIQKTQPLVAIVGPTAVGKTEISLQLAKRLDGEIISADSRLFYLGMDIGTAKPTAAERAQVAHYLIDITNPDQVVSLAVFQQMAVKAIKDIHRRGKIPILVGGTGQFVKAITEGWRIPEVPPDNLMRAALSNWSRTITPHGLHQRLAVLDPLAADEIDARNVRRTIRALEVIFHTGYRFSDQKGRNPMFDHVIVVGLNRPRHELYTRIDHRIQGMLEMGFIDEVQTLLDQGYLPDIPAFSAIGYREVIAYLRGRVTYDEAVKLIQRQTRVFVRRQANWFKLSDPGIHWFRLGPGSLEQIEESILDWLKKISA